MAPSSSYRAEFKQELSYRKQIARQLRTQFVEGIFVTLKSTLRVTQGHWKRNHWTDHTRLTVRRVIGRWILSWPWNVGQRSLKIIESGTIWKFGYGFLTFPTLTLTLGLGLGLGSRSLTMAPFDRPYATFYWSAIVNIALSCTIFQLFDVE